MKAGSASAVAIFPKKSTAKLFRLRSWPPAKSLRLQRHVRNRNGNSHARSRKIIHGDVGRCGLRAIAVRARHVLRVPNSRSRGQNNVADNPLLGAEAWALSLRATFVHGLSRCGRIQSYSGGGVDRNRQDDERLGESYDARKLTRRTQN